MYKIVVITVQNYVDAEFHTTTLRNRELFWVKVIDIQNGRGIKNISDLVRKEIHDIFETKNPTKEQIRKYKRTEKESNPECNSNSKFARSNLTEKIMKNCRGVKKCKNRIK